MKPKVEYTLRNAAMDTCIVPPSFFGDFSGWQAHYERLAYEDIKPRWIPVKPPCSYCGTVAGDDKFHPGTCENCGGPRIQKR